MNLFDQPGKPFGYAWLEERTKIEDHVLRRTKHSIPLYDLRVQSRVHRIQDRLHKYDKTFAQRSREWREEQERQSAAERNSAEIIFTREELERIIEHFGGANDPVTAGIAAKAQAALDSLPG